MNLNATLIAQMVVFLILAWFTMKFVWPPLIKALDDRAKKIADGLAAADRGKAELEAAGKRIDQELLQARNEGQQRIADAEKRAQSVADEIRRNAQAEAARIVATAKADADQQIVKARESLRNEIATLAVRGAEQILRREVDQKAHAELLNQLKAELLIMAELATIARPYAEALFRVAEKGDLAVWSSLIQELAEVASSPQVLSLSRNPRVSRTRVTDLLLTAVNSPVDEHAKNLVTLLVDNHRLDVLPEIATQFEALKNEREGAADVNIVSAFDLADGDLTSLVASLEKKFKRKLKPHVKVDRSLIGGVRVTVGDEVLDTSVRARLSQMQTALTA